MCWVGLDGVSQWAAGVGQSLVPAGLELAEGDDVESPIKGWVGVGKKGWFDSLEGV